ncbi:alpha/beta fold hydrolase [Runella sp.]|uniref:alpha/beta fold hydrolase n=1 Tax=Runella sp. TaxID=1960881 RepID=UPI003D119518
MKRFSTLTLVTAILGLQPAFAQQKATYQPKIEPCPCAFKADSSLTTKCAYLIVPENRNKPAGKTVKLPFIVVESNNPYKKKDPVLFTGGGPGASSLGIVRSVHMRSLIKNRDFIAFEQRGTRFAVPSLDCNEMGEALKNAFKYNLPKDSMILAGVKRCREKLAAQGIDLSGYTTLESAADIEDLRRALKIDSLNLYGISYSGGLMMSVLQHFPTGIRSLILDSPLPEFINIDEEEPVNFNEALHTAFKRHSSDSLSNTVIGPEELKFKRYFSSIKGKKFLIRYVEKGTKDTLTLHYSSSELIGILVNKLYDFSRLKDVPAIVSEMVRGNHEQFIRDFLNGIFQGGGPSGMRLSVYCSDKMAYARDEVIRQQYDLYAYMEGAGYYLHDVTRPMCDCWKVPSIPVKAKTPFYSNVPVLLAAGDTDPACRPVYNDQIHHYMPNSQRLLFQNRSHGPLIREEGNIFIEKFLNNPNEKIVSHKKDIIAY